MTPVPVIALFASVIALELAIISVPFAKVDAIGMVFAVIPLMIVAMIAIVVAMMIAFMRDDNFLRSARFGCCYGGKCRSKKKETQISGCYVHVWSSLVADSNVGVLACSKYARKNFEILYDNGHFKEYESYSLYKRVPI